MADDNAYEGALSNDVVPFIAANMYPAEDLAAYEGYQLTSISFWRTTNPYEDDLAEPKFKWFVSQGGERLFSEEVVNSKLRWNTIQLENPIPIDVSKPLYYGVEVVECDPEDWPLGAGTFYSEDANGGTDMMIANGRGNIYSEDDGQTWIRISDVCDICLYDLYCIRATLAKDPSIEPKEHVMGYRVLRNGENLVGMLLGETIRLVQLNNLTDINPLPKGQEACYTVETVYLHQVVSEGATTCITIKGTALVKVETGLKVYPNTIKRNETIQVELPDNWKKAVIELYDLSGKKIKTVQATGPKTPLQLNVETGVYLLKINKEAVKLIVK
jgi:hypothetical protein